MFASSDFLAAVPLFGDAEIFIHQEIRVSSDVSIQLCIGNAVTGDCVDEKVHQA